MTQKVKTAISGITTELKRSLNQFKASKTSVGTYKNRINELKNAHAQLKYQIGSLKVEHQNLSSEQGRNSEAAKRLADKINVEKIKMQELSGQIQHTESDLKAFQKEQKITASLSATAPGRAIQSVNKYQDKLRDASNTMKNVGRTSMIYMTAPIVAGMGGAVKASIDWEDALAGVAKTTDMTGKELSQMGNKIIDMSNRLPFAATEIAGVAEAAGQLGVKKSSIMDFTKTMLDLSVATNMTADEASVQFARFANAAGMTIDDVDRLGSAVVNLGNNTATTEKEIIDMGQRLAGAGAQAGFSADEIMSVSAAMSSVGIESEAGGTAMTQIFNKMTKAAASGGSELEAFADTAGMSGEQFAKTWENNPTKALSAFIEGLSHTSGGAKGVQSALESVGITGIREADTVRRMANNHEVLDDALKVGKDGWKENNALTDEAAIRYETLKSKLKTLKNNFVNLGKEIGDAVSPAVGWLADKLSAAFKGLQNSSNGTKIFVAALGGILATLPPVLFLAGGFAGALVNIAKLLSGIPALAGVFSVLTGPIGITVAAVAALGTAFVIAYKKSETFRNVVHTVIDPVVEGVKKLWFTVKNVFTGIKSLFEGNDELGTQLLNKIFPPEVVEGIKTAVDTIKEKVKSVFDAVSGFARNIGDKLRAFWEENGQQILEALQNIRDFVLPIWESIKTVILTGLGIIWKAMKFVWPVIEWLIKAVWNNIKGVISGALDIIMGVLKVFSGLFTGDWIKLWEGIKQILSGAAKILWNIVQLWFIDKILGIFKLFGRFIGQIFGKIKDFILDVWIGISKRVSGLVVKIVGGVIRQFNKLRETIFNIFNSVKSFLYKIWTTIKDEVILVAIKIWEGVKKRFNKLKNSITLIFNSIKNFLYKVWTTIKDKITNTVEKLKATVLKIFHKLEFNIKRIFLKIKITALKIWETIKEKIGNIVGKLKDGVLKIFNKFKNSIKNIFTKIKTTALNIWEGIKDEVVKFVTTLKEKVLKLLTQMKNGIKKVVDKIRDFFGDMVKGVKKGLNKLIRGVNWVGEKLGMKPLKEIKLHTGTESTHTQNLVTNGKINQDTMATVGDKGRGNGPGGFRHEMIRYPNGKMALTPNRDTTAFLPAGSSVYNGAQTHSMLSESMPAFAGGTTKKKNFIDAMGETAGKTYGKLKEQGHAAMDTIGSKAKDAMDWGKDKFDKIKSAAGKGVKWLKDTVGDIADWIGKPKKLFKKVMEAFGINLESFGIPKAAKLPFDMMKGMFKKLKDAAIDFIRNALDEFLGSDGGYNPFANNPKFHFERGWSPNGHAGIDYSADVGTKIPSPLDGKVIKSWWSPNGGGNETQVYDGHKYTHIFMHQKDGGRKVKTGDKVSQGQTLGLVGSTGNSTGPHVHWQVNKGKGYLNNHPDSIDPLKWVKEAAKANGKKQAPNKWRKTIRRAAKQMHVKLSKSEEDGIVAQIARESNGDPGVTQGNIGDINNRNGTPAQGLLQYVPATFDNYAVKGHHNINSGYDQLLAFFNNKNWRSDLPHGRSGWSPTGARRFATGGLIRQSGLYQLAEAGHPEWVIPTDPKRHTDAMKLLALAGKDLMRKDNNKRPNSFNVPKVGSESNDNSELISILKQQVNTLEANLVATQEQNSLLKKLIVSTQNIERQPKGFNERDISNAQGERYRSFAFNLGLT
ncbi:phage tail tape measure protein [Staphylococcus auricularis]|uniref:phage tail tape measure protein n=1 Tax=Staphylococcus auricularis TaxID=29379 RepID=UPI002432D141|nr:phage tail tape measure protein [Staphylococcus auricularis]